MRDAAYQEIRAHRRVPLVPHFPFIEELWTGSTFKMQVRQTRDTTGTPLIDDTAGNVMLVYSGTATVAAHVAAGRLENGIYEITNPATGVPYVAADSLVLSEIGIGIVAASIASLPSGPERGDPFEAWYDIIRTPFVGDAEVIMEGPFIVLPGVTIP